MITQQFVQTVDKDIDKKYQSYASPSSVGNPSISTEIPLQNASNAETEIAKFLGPTWGPPGSYRSQMGPMLAMWTLVPSHGVTISLTGTTNI